MRFAEVKETTGRRHTVRARRTSRAHVQTTTGKVVEVRGPVMRPWFDFGRCRDSTSASFNHEGASPLRRSACPFLRPLPPRAMRPWLSRPWDQPLSRSDCKSREYSLVKRQEPVPRIRGSRRRGSPAGQCRLQIAYWLIFLSRLSDQSCLARSALLVNQILICLLVSFLRVREDVRVLERILTDFAARQQVATDFWFATKAACKTRH